MVRRPVSEADYILTPEEVVRFRALIREQDDAGHEIFMRPMALGRPPTFEINSRKLTARRVAWTLVNGQIPAGMMIRPKCESRLCVAVEHMKMVGRSDNLPWY